MAKKRSAQTHAKREREFAVKERRDRKRAKKAEAVAQRAAAREAVAPSTSQDDESPTRQALIQGSDSEEVPPATSGSSAGFF